MQYHSCVCALLGMQQNLRIKVNPGVERGLYSIASGKRTFWDSYNKIVTFYLNIFVKKCKTEYQKQNKQKKQTNKKKTDPFFPNILGRSEKGKHTFCFCLIRLKHRYSIVYHILIVRNLPNFATRFNKTKGNWKLPNSSRTAWFKMSFTEQCLYM